MSRPWCYHRNNAWLSPVHALTMKVALQIKSVLCRTLSWLHYCPSHKKRSRTTYANWSAHTTFNRDTTLPDVIRKCVCSGQDISKTYEDILYRTISDVVGRLLRRLQSSAHLLTSLYCFCLLERDQHVKQLHLCNLVYFEHGEYKLVYDRSILTQYLTESAKQYHAQMLQYDVGRGQRTFVQSIMPPRSDKSAMFWS